MGNRIVYQDDDDDDDKIVMMVVVVVAVIVVDDSLVGKADNGCVGVQFLKEGGRITI